MAALRPISIGAEILVPYRQRCADHRVEADFHSLSTGRESLRYFLAYAGVACVISYLFSGHAGIYQARQVGRSKHIHKVAEDDLLNSLNDFGFLGRTNMEHTKIAALPSHIAEWTEEQKKVGFKQIAERCELMVAFEHDAPASRILPSSMGNAEESELAMTVCASQQSCQRTGQTGRNS